MVTVAETLFRYQCQLLNLLFTRLYAVLKMENL